MRRWQVGVSVGQVLVSPGCCTLLSHAGAPDPLLTVHRDDDGHVRQRQRRQEHEVDAEGGCGVGAGDRYGEDQGDQDPECYQREGRGIACEEREGGGNPVRAKVARGLGIEQL